MAVWSLNARLSNKMGSVDDLPNGWELVGPSAVSNQAPIINDVAAEKLQELEPAGIMNFTCDPQGNLVTVTVSDVDALLNLMREKQLMDRLEVLETALIRVEHRGGT